MNADEKVMFAKERLLLLVAETIGYWIKNKDWWISGEDANEFCELVSQVHHKEIVFPHCRVKKGRKAIYKCVKSC